jgi:hypothetical protein
MNKLRNTKVTVNGETYDSKKEYNRWCELKILERTGFISDLKRQVEYELLPKQVETYERYGKNGKRLKDGERVLELPVRYIADFEYIQNGKKVVEDVKGYRDPNSATYAKFVLKRKMMLWLKGIRVIEV